ncbi:MAG: biotin/lipoyl-containing protein, partial [Gemmatimonadota bacterium]
MAKQITMPKLSDTMEEGKVLRWLKAEGDRVERGEPIAEVETDKADMEMEAFDAGVLLSIAVPEGASAAVGDVIGWIGEPGEKPEGAPGAGDGGPEAGEEASSAHRPDDGDREADEAARSAPEPRARTRAPRPAAPKPAVEAAASPPKAARRPGNAEVPGPHADIADVIEPEGANEAEEGEEGSSRQAPGGAADGGRRGRPSKGMSDRLPPARESRERPARTAVSPVARRLAQQAGLDPASLQGSGPDGRIVRRDVEAALRE